MGTFFSAAGLPSFLGAGVKGSLKGCAADVDVAAGGACDEEAEPCRGAGAELAATGVARRTEPVVKARVAGIEAGSGILARDAARRHVRQIIVGEGADAMRVWMGAMREDGQKFEMGRRNVLPGEWKPKGLTSVWFLCTMQKPSRARSILLD